MNFSELFETFRPFDEAVGEHVHSLLESFDTILTPLALIFDVIGEVGAFGALVALILMLFAKTRHIGLGMVISIVCGALCTNVVLKGLFSRARPFESGEPFLSWWEAAGAHAQGGFSFPSGHVTSAACAAFALIICYFLSVRAPFRRENDKERSLRIAAAILVPIGAVAYVLIMAFARCYIFVHYASDTVAGMIVGALCAPIASALTVLCYRLCLKWRESRLSRFVLDADIRSLFTRKK